MAKIVVTKIVREGKTTSGTPKWNCMGTIDGEADVFDVWDKPEIGVEFEGTVKDSQYGKSVSTGGGRGNRGGGYRRDPEEGRSIARQNALAHSTEVMITIAKMTFEAAENKQDGLTEAKALLQPSKIITVAKHLYAWSRPADAAPAAAPASQPASTPQQPTSTAQVPMTKEAVNAAFPETADQQNDPTPAKGQDVNPTDIPF